MTTHFGIASASSSSSISRSASSSRLGTYGRTFAASQSTGPSIAFAYGSISSLSGLKRWPARRVVVAVDAVAVALARPDPRDVAVPVERLASVSSMRVSRSSASNRQSSTRAAFSEKSEKFVPCPSQVGPRGNGWPGQTSISGESLPASSRSRRGDPSCRAGGAAVSPPRPPRRPRAPAAASAAARAARGRADRASRGSSFERRNVSSACGSGTCSPAKDANASNSRRLPVRVASAIAGSMWSVKNWKGRSSKYSSPMKRSGVHGEKSVTAAATLSASGGRRSPTARFPTWS